MRPIDGDKLKRKVQKVATEEWKMKVTARVETVLNQFIDYIDNAPTIESSAQPEPEELDFVQPHKKICVKLKIGQPEIMMNDLISRQAAIDAIRGEIEINGYSHVVDVLEQMPSAQPEQRWIPCSKRLPEQYGNYLVSYRTDDFESDIGTFDPDRINSDTGKWSACDANGFYWVASKGLEVIAWMPLPEPYKGGEKDG